jgi:catechol 2,3-dioxygenase-like lactoylglutathione lyase family enzyme
MEVGVQKQIRKTGDYGIGIMIHSVHMTDDVPTLNRFYEEVFGGLVYMGVDSPNWLPVEDRWAGLVQIGDLCIETMAPNMPADPTKPVGKFYTKFGRHLHSVGYKVDDLVGLGNHLISKGIYIGAPGGGKLEKVAPDTVYFYPSPRDTAGLMVELCAVDMPDDPRLLPTWSSQVKMWELGHPLGIRRLAYITLGVRDLESATRIYVDAMQAVPVHEGLDDGGRFRYQIVQIGDCLLQLAQPLDEESPLGRHVARWGNMIYGITFKVRDLGSVENWLEKKNIRTSRPNPTVVAADPEDTYGAPYFFTTDEIPNDPFGA